MYISGKRDAKGYRIYQNQNIWGKRATTRVSNMRKGKKRFLMRIKPLMIGQFKLLTGAISMKACIEKYMNHIYEFDN